MRRSHLVFLLATIAFLTLALHSVSTLLSLLVEDAATDVIHPSEIPAINSSLNSSLPQLIPKIIHQTYINASIPERWRPAQESCLELHPDYEYKFWSDEDSHTFIQKEYPWFLETFEQYAHNIQRADTIRYFVLAHYGGVYIDLDNGCRRRLDPLLSFPAWVHLTDPTGISNDGMGATPRHPFFLYVIDQLQAYNRQWGLPYITIMSSTGPLFLSVIWKRYMQLHWKEGVDWKGRVRVLTPREYYQHDTSFFDLHYGGSSWHGNDAKFITWVGQHWLSVTVAGFTFAAGFGLCIWWVCKRILLLRIPRDYRAAGGSSPSLLSQHGFRLPQWRVWQWRNGKHEYELAEQRDTS
jgi:inositol phosphorylceramide mannosyltransferase catalytic subunit